MFGYTGKIGIVDLTTQQFSTIPVEEHLIKNFLGGRGFIIRLLYDLIPSGADPLGPENVLIFASGPLNGTLAPTSGRWMVGAKSPATSMLVSGNGGGFLGAEFKWAGFDAVVIKGKAEKPYYLMLRDEKIEILPAAFLWGKDTWQTEELIQTKHKDPEIRVASIGIAGENLSPMASIFGDKVHHGGRGGVGAVMGSKNLKALAIKGTGGVKVADPAALVKEAKHIIELVMGESHYSMYTTTGSSRGTTLYSKLGGLTTFNGQSGVFDGFDKIEADNFMRYKLKGQTRACFGCPMACFHQFLVPEGNYAGTFGSGIQNSTIQCFGAKVGNSNIEALLNYHVMSGKYGLDQISAGLAIAFAMECFQKKIITESDTGGLILEWGSERAISELLRMIAAGEGIGKILGQGVQKAAQHFGGGSEKFALHVHNLEISTVDPRIMQAWALGYVTSSRGGHHMRTYPVWEWGVVEEKLLIKIAGTTDATDRTKTTGKGKGVAFSEDARAITDCLQMCKTFSRLKIGMPETTMGILNAVTGRSWTEPELLQIGERINNLERLFNLREGFKLSNETLPDRMLHEPVPDGASKGMVADLEPMLNDYYTARGWQRETGYPTPAKLSELGLETDKEKAKQKIENQKISM